MKTEDTKKGHSKSTWIILGVLLVVNVIFTGLLSKAISEKKHLEAQFSENRNMIEDVREEINITVPQTIYVAKGITMEIYNSQVTSMGEDITKYNILWNCEVGENLERKFSVSTDEINTGNYKLTLEIYDNALELKAKKEFNLVVVEGKSEAQMISKEISDFQQIPEECLGQVRACVDTKYHGALTQLKAEGILQMQAVLYSVLSGTE